jgi:alkylation response protein AidB-like acyl-CoA dehydrogenase
VTAARRHNEEIICPNVDHWESTSEYPLEAAAETAKFGLLGLYSPGEYGGQALSFEEGVPVFEELGKREGL